MCSKYGFENRLLQVISAYCDGVLASPKTCSNLYIWSLSDSPNDAVDRVDADGQQVRFKHTVDFVICKSQKQI